MAAAHAEVHGVGRVPRVPFECRLWFRLLLLLPFELFAGLLGRCGEAHGPLPLLLGLLLGLPDGTGFVFTFARETPPVIDARPVEARKAEDAGHWTSVAGYGEVFTTTELFDVTAARDHFDGTVEAVECRFCAFDARNREHHAQNAGKLF